MTETKKVQQNWRNQLLF